MTVSKDTKTNTWHYSIYVYNEHGNKCRKRKGNFKSKKEALYEEDLVKSKYSIYDVNNKQYGLITLDQLNNIYYEQHLIHQASNTIVQYKRAYAILLEYFDKDTKLKSFNASTCLGFRKYLENKPYATNTKNTLLVFVKTMFNYAVELDYLEENPFKKYTKMYKKTFEDKLKEKEKIKVWSIEEFDYFISSQCNTDKRFLYKVLFTILFDTGMRLNECLSLTWSCYDEENSTLKVYRQYDRRKKRFNAPKTVKSERTIKITQQDKTLLNQLKNGYFSHFKLNEDYFIFGGYIPIDKSTVEKNLKTWTINAGLTYITVHGLRHSHTSYLFNNDFDIMYISKRLGHSNIQTTLNIYTHMTNDIQLKDNELLDLKLKHGD